MKKILYCLMFLGIVIGAKQVLAMNFGVGTTGIGTMGVGMTGPSSGGALTCSDTDEKNIYTKGSVTYTYYINGKDGAKATKTIYDVCNGSGSQVNEMYCYKYNNGNMYQGRLIYSCVEGKCVDGACLKVTPTPTKVPTPTPVKKKPACSDTDARDLYNKGSITTVSANGSTLVLTDVCTNYGKKVAERYCYESPWKSGNFYGSFTNYSCPNGCMNGACLRVSSPTPTSIGKTGPR